MYQARKQALEQMAMERIVKAEAAKPGLNEQDYIRKRVEESPVQRPSRGAGAAVLRAAEERLGRFPRRRPSRTLKDRIVQALVSQQRQAQVQVVVGELQKQANLKLDLPQTAHPGGGRRSGPRAQGRAVTIVEFSDFECPYCGAAHERWSR